MSTHTKDCPMCSEANQPQGRLGHAEHYLCRACGWWYTSASDQRAVVSQWRQRFFRDRLAGLEERARPGRPRVFPPRAHG